MAEPVNTYRYISFLASRWRFIALTCAIAAGLVLARDLTSTKQYTATCRVLIEPPADRSAAVTPIYLEALKTYEHFAASDSLFFRALDEFHLRQKFPEWHTESLLKKILKVEMLRDTKILEINVTLPDAGTAHALADYLGDKTVELNRRMARESEEELTQVIAQQEQEAHQRLDHTEAEWQRFASEQPILTLQEETENGGILAGSLERQLLRAEVDASGPPSPESSAARAKADKLREQLAQVKRDLAARQQILARRLAAREHLSTERTASQENYSAALKRLSQARSDMGYRSERLTVIDPGIVPERPSAPNLMLHLFAALLLGVAVPVIYLTLELSYRNQRAVASPTAMPVPLRPTGTRHDE
jgi:capsule polysaccharide export protein KpsE/RkpR